ncbi:MAG: hypothetical protein HY536_01715 [Candidatus Colwellbacteria bacterium]|nr:hypothetical protein [Candidatus Colwellbacteria bacterium]
MRRERSVPPHTTALFSRAAARERVARSVERRGVAALPMVLLIAGILVELVTASALLSTVLSRSSLGARLSEEAFTIAHSGVSDAIGRVLKGTVPSNYSLVIDAATNKRADIVVEKDPPDLGACLIAWGCRYRIRSTGRSVLRARQIEAILDVDPANREIKVQSVREKVL